jgi:hypothetical protein
MHREEGAPEIEPGAAGFDCSRANTPTVKRDSISVWKKMMVSEIANTRTRARAEIINKIQIVKVTKFLATDFTHAAASVGAAKPSFLFLVHKKTCNTRENI